MEAKQKPLVFYDFLCAPPLRTFAPNPWKTRLALNLKAAPYRTAWTDLPDIEPTRKRLGVPASRKFLDGSDYHTLPLLYDAEADKYVGDSFEIALHLDERFPDGPRLVAPGAAGVTKAWNDRVDALFSRFVRLGVHRMPLNPDSADRSRQMFVDRARAHMLPYADGPAPADLTFDDLAVAGDERADLLAGFRAALAEFDETYYAYARGDGPFLDGDRPTYADLIVAGWVGMMHEVLPPHELADFQTWQNGHWAKLWKALAKYADIV
ncbi:hypothetical protein CDD83_9477 [Cordyceps sp. RAO-2017]|nr:hypothetical protein CDD83_9477 [Cordyceps sp. RAO-2017]